MYAGNLSSSWGEEKIRNLFSAYGEVYKVDLFNDRGRYGHPRGFGFIKMDADNADAAICAGAWRSSFAGQGVPCAGPWRR